MSTGKKESRSMTLTDCISDGTKKLKGGGTLEGDRWDFGTVKAGAGPPKSNTSIIITGGTMTSMTSVSGRDTIIAGTVRGSPKIPTAIMKPAAQKVVKDEIDSLDTIRGGGESINRQPTSVVTTTVPITKGANYISITPMSYNGQMPKLGVLNRSNGNLAMLGGRSGSQGALNDVVKGTKIAETVKQTITRVTPFFFLPIF